eukprot:CAMPEP_0196571504 /NCGR_PEP_ID=MMETSP1081-20130531/1666_1 /TAXON_ID=36882 /ORGANISM="Pyramimonas amylifera, Strain CCMP720" /LENGTH=537 /DNA_ID=CAMNT_0041888475 /DNA_START=37 /DNA_END=1650 /DNA_ORIENTATION=-
MTHAPRSAQFAPSPKHPKTLASLTGRAAQADMAPEKSSKDGPSKTPSGRGKSTPPSSSTKKLLKSLSSSSSSKPKPASKMTKLEPELVQIHPRPPLAPEKLVRALDDVVERKLVAEARAQRHIAEEEKAAKQDLPEDAKAAAKVPSTLLEKPPKESKVVSESRSLGSPPPVSSLFSSLASSSLPPSSSTSSRSSTSSASPVSIPPSFNTSSPTSAPTAANTCQAPTCYCRTDQLPCRRAYCKTHVRWPVRPPPMRALGFPVFASDSKLEPERYSVQDFIRHQGMSLPAGVTKQEMPMPKELFQGTNFTSASCAIVGNSGVLSLSKYGKQIDAHDIVFRLNQAPTKGYESVVGAKTSVRLLNALWSSNYGKPYKLKSYELPLERGLTFITSRGEFLVKNFKTLHAHMKKTRSDVKVLMINHRAVAKAKMLLAVFRNCLGSGGTQFSGGRVPTSGLVSVFALKDICSHLTAYGFGRHPQANYQYYVLHGTQRSFGNPTHSFGAEGALIRGLAYEKLITLCGPKGCMGAPQAPSVIKAGR